MINLNNETIIDYGTTQAGTSWFLLSDDDGMNISVVATDTALCLYSLGDLDAEQIEELKKTNNTENLIQELLR